MLYYIMLYCIILYFIIYYCVSHHTPISQGLLPDYVTCVPSFVADQTHLAKEKALADAEFYKSSKEAESNKVAISELLLQYSSGDMLSL